MRQTQIDSSHMMVISPDARGRHRKSRTLPTCWDWTWVCSISAITRKSWAAANPIVAHEFLGASVEGKDVLIIDDMISSGESVMDVS